MRSSTPNTHPGPAVDAHWRAIFEDRYGAGALDQLLNVLKQPCLTFAEIAERFGVTRERVRQWHLQLMPGTPRGHERRRLCWLHRQRHQLLQDPLFRSFYANVRRHFEPGDLRLLATRNGFRKHAVQLNRRVVLIREAPCASRKQSTFVHTLRVGSKPGDFIYYQLSGTDFLFVPRSALPERGTTFMNNGKSKYLRFRNSFRAALANPDGDEVEPTRRGAGDSLATGRLRQSPNEDRPSARAGAGRLSLRMQSRRDSPEGVTCHKE